MDSSIWVYPWDLQDEGIENVLDRLQANGINGVNVTMNYHSGHFFLPHNPNRKVHFPESGALYFNPSSWHENGVIKPPISRFASADFWRDLREATKERGMKMTAWSLALHNSFIGFNYPQTCVENAFGDKLPTCLAAENADMRRFLLDFYTDISTHFDFDNIIIESLEYMPFRHGYHHEVIGIPVGNTADFFMSLSFSGDMFALAAQKGIDLEAVRAFVRDYCEKSFNGTDTLPELGWPEIYAAAGGEMGRYLDLREELLLGLMSEISPIIKANGKTSLSVIDFGPLYSLGLNGQSWQNGINLGKLSSLVDEVHPTFYFADLDTNRKKYQEYLKLVEGLPAKVKVVPAVRSILPQITCQKDMQGYMDMFYDSADGLSFYNYGFMSYEILSWIGDEMKKRGV